MLSRGFFRYERNGVEAVEYLMDFQACTRKLPAGSVLTLRFSRGDDDLKPVLRHMGREVVNIALRPTDVGFSDDDQYLCFHDFGACFKVFFVALSMVSQYDSHAETRISNPPR